MCVVFALEISDLKSEIASLNHQNYTALDIRPGIDRRVSWSTSGSIMMTTTYARVEQTPVETAHYFELRGKIRAGLQTAMVTGFVMVSGPMTSIPTMWPHPWIVPKTTYYFGHLLQLPTKLIALNLTVVCAGINRNQESMALRPPSLVGNDGSRVWKVWFHAHAHSSNHAPIVEQPWADIAILCLVHFNECVHPVGMQRFQPYGFFRIFMETAF